MPNQGGPAGTSGSRNTKRRRHPNDEPRRKIDHPKKVKRDIEEDRPKPNPQQSKRAIVPHSKYNVGWICALPVELAAAEGMLDEVHEPLSQPQVDSNTYILGMMAKHNVAIACLPSYGTANAAIVATHMRRTFSSICVWLLVGIGGGAPSTDDIRLGDVVVSTTVFQSDLGKIESGGRLRPTGLARTPSHDLMTAVSALRAKHRRSPSIISSLVGGMLQKHPLMTEFGDPGAHEDVLFDSGYEHNPQSKEDCDSCDRSMALQREARTSREPIIHYRPIASANHVMKNAKTRDHVAAILGNICFEMEAGGMMESFSCIVIKGTSDYSDSHKNKKWQCYAAATAAAYAKELLSTLPSKDTTPPELPVQRTAPHSRRRRRGRPSAGQSKRAAAHQIRNIKAGDNARQICHSDNAPLHVDGVSAGDNSVQVFGSGASSWLQEVLQGPKRIQPGVRGEGEVVEVVAAVSGSGSRTA